MLSRPSRGAIVASLAFLAGCSKTKSDSAPEATLTVAPATADVAPHSAPITFRATLTHSTAAIGWAIVQGTCVFPGSVDPLSGEYTPPATNDAACTLKIRATAGTLTADSTVNLGARYLRVTPSNPAVTPGDAAFSFHAEQAGLTGGTTWSVDDGTCAAGTYGTFDTGTGLYTPPAANAAACAFEVTATVDGLSASSTAGLSSATPAVVTVTASASSVAPGGSVTFTATVDPVEASPALAWSTTGLSGGTLVPSGDKRSAVYTAPATVASPSSVTVTATVAGGMDSKTLSVSASTGGGGAAGDGLREMTDAFGALMLECSGEPWQAEIDAVVTAVQAAVDAGKMIYSATAKDACLARIESMTCVDLMHGADVASCVQGVFSGTVASGGGCGDSGECAAGYCDLTAGTCPGTCTAFVALDGACGRGEECAAGLACDGVHCVAPTTVAIGGACNGNDLVCAAGSACGFDPSTWTNQCLPIGQVGDACDSFDGCAATLLCDATNTGTCLEPAPRGASCAAAACNPFTDYCSPATVRCTAIPTLGQSCADSGSCAAGSYCDSTGSGTCLALPGLGEDCSASRSTNGVRCSGTAYCDYDPVDHTRTCVAPIDPGSACFDNGTCVAGYYCNAVRPSAGTCVVQKAAGSSCVDHWDCQGDLPCLGGICSLDTCY